MYICSPICGFDDFSKICLFLSFYLDILFWYFSVKIREIRVHKGKRTSQFLEIQCSLSRVKGIPWALHATTLAMMITASSLQIFIIKKKGTKRCYQLISYLTEWDSGLEFIYKANQPKCWIIIFWGDHVVKSAVFLWSFTVLGAFIHIRLPAPSQLYHVPHQNDHFQPPPPYRLNPLPITPFVIMWFTLIEMPLKMKWFKSFLASFPSALLSPSIRHHNQVYYS